MKMQFFAFACILALGTLKMHAQELTLDDNKFKLAKQVVAKVEKKKNGFLSVASFHLVDAASNVNAKVEYKSLYYSPGQQLASWYNIYIGTDSISLYQKQLGDEVKLPFMGPNDESWAKFFFKYNLVNKDGSLNPQAITKMHETYSVDLSKLYYDSLAKWQVCQTSISTLVERPKDKAPELVETGREDYADGKNVRIRFNIVQGGVVVGTVEAAGSKEKAKDELAEVQHSPGIASLDKEPPLLNYYFYVPSGCLAANYDAQEKLLFTEKGGHFSHPFGSHVQIRLKDIQTRQEYITKLAQYLIGKGYL